MHKNDIILQLDQQPVLSFLIYLSQFTQYHKQYIDIKTMAYTNR